MDFLNEILSISVFSILGIILMILGNFLIDFIIPCHFPTEIKKGNNAVGWLSAGSFIGIGIILKSAIMSPTTQVVKETILTGIIGSVAYFLLGVVFFIIGYIIIGVFNKKYNLNEEIGNGNTAAGIMVFGVFIGLAIIISGVIY